MKEKMKKKKEEKKKNKKGRIKKRIEKEEYVGIVTGVAYPRCGCKELEVHYF